MRLLFTFAGGNGHFEPLAPIARAARQAGHAVVFAAQPAMQAPVEAAGFAMIPTGGATLGSTPERFPLLKLDLEREDRDLRDGFARRLARERSAAILAVCAEWRPDLLVCDEIDFGAMIAAEKLGLPAAKVLVIAAGSFVRPEVVGAALDEVRAEHGLPADPDLSMLSRDLVLSPFPPGYRDPAFPLPATARSLRPITVGPGDAGRLPPWPGRLDDAPLVYFTLGTVFNVESGDLFERVLAGLGTQPVNVMATVGRQLDPAVFGPQPPNIRIERYIPQAALLPLCAAVISHGGSGSVIGALAHGLPMVLLPMGADQPRNAQRCADLGVARALDATEATPELIGAAIAAVLEEPGYRRAAELMRAEIAALPDPEIAVALLERLAGRRPSRP